MVPVSDICRIRIYLSWLCQWIATFEKEEKKREKKKRWFFLWLVSCEWDTKDTYTVIMPWQWTVTGCEIYSAFFVTVPVDWYVVKNIGPVGLFFSFFLLSFLILGCASGLRHKHSWLCQWEDKRDMWLFVTVPMDWDINTCDCVSEKTKEAKVTCTYLWPCQTKTWFVPNMSAWYLRTLRPTSSSSLTWELGVISVVQTNGFGRGRDYVLLHGCAKRTNHEWRLPCEMLCFVIL